MRRRNAAERVACQRPDGYSVNEHVGYLVGGSRRDREGLARIVVDSVHAGRCDRAVEPVRGCEGERVDREGDADGASAYHVAEHIACDCACGAAVDEHVGDMVSCGRGHVEGLASAVVHRHRAGRAYGSVGACGGNNDVSIDCEVRSDRDGPVEVGTCGACDPVAP